jgi:hypothetical protein
MKEKPPKKVTKLKEKKNALRDVSDCPLEPSNHYPCNQIKFNLPIVLWITCMIMFIAAIIYWFIKFSNMYAVATPDKALPEQQVISLPLKELTNNDH